MIELFFTLPAEPPHIIERPDSEQGQKLSWQKDKKPRKDEPKRVIITNPNKNGG